jgi:hypothetical protein
VLAGFGPRTAPTSGWVLQTKSPNLLPRVMDRFASREACVEGLRARYEPEVARLEALRSQWQSVDVERKPLSLRWTTRNTAVPHPQQYEARCSPEEIDGGR